MKTTSLLPNSRGESGTSTIVLSQDAILPEAPPYSAYETDADAPKAYSLPTYKDIEEEEKEGEEEEPPTYSPTYQPPSFSTDDDRDADSHRMSLLRRTYNQVLRCQPLGFSKAMILIFMLLVFNGIQIYKLAIVTTESPAIAPPFPVQLSGVRGERSAIEDIIQNGWRIHCDKESGKVKVTRVKRRRMTDRLRELGDASPKVRVDPGLVPERPTIITISHPDVYDLEAGVPWWTAPQLDADWCTRARHEVVENEDYGRSRSVKEWREGMRRALPIHVALETVVVVLFLLAAAWKENDDDEDNAGGCLMSSRGDEEWVADEKRPLLSEKRM